MTIPQVLSDEHIFKDWCKAKEKSPRTSHQVLSFARAIESATIEAMAKQDPADEMALFESTMREKHGWEDRDFRHDGFGYFDGHTATAWMAWQARATLKGQQ